MSRFVTKTLITALMALPAAASAVDLNGRWHFSGIGFSSSIVTVTQTGSALSIPVIATFTGTVGATDANGFTSYSVSWTDGTNHAGFGGRVMPSGNFLDGRVVAFFPPNPPEGGGQVVATRCTCFDNNSVNGDGCDATCQVEPCWTCVGDPSMCTPTADGGACDDLSPCTTGESCTLGVCGGGAPAAPCFDIAGPWTLHSAIPGLDVLSHTTANISQRGSDVQIGGYVGHIDASTGALNVRSANPYFFCGPFDFLVGAVAPDGLTFSMSGSVSQPQEFAPDHCDSFAQTLLGDHCGDGDLEGAEACDDGNLVEGDGCSTSCQVEDCYSCAGVPSVCTPVAGVPCDDENECTISDTCAGDGACVGTPDPGVPCNDDNACTADDTCDGAGSCGGTAVVCGQCHECDTVAGCVPDPGLTCDDGDACTPNSVCQFDGTCIGIGGISCDLCFTCNPEGGCVDRPKPVCKTSTAPMRSLIHIKNGTADEKDRFNWRWSKGADVALTELDGDATLCAYDESGATPALIFKVGIPDEGLRVWSPTGYRYKDYSASSDGLTIAVLKSGTAGKSSARLKGKGVHLSDRPYPLPGVPVPLPLRVQLQSEDELCLETHHDSSSVLQNELGSFKAKGAP